ncbi:MAG: hypothetical protein H6735_32765 [Alphaproteobacteria bacterium]|nr:hypothetical protein [Alphaproteobacteria bacterium]
MLDHPGDTDRFGFDWGGGDLTLRATIPDVSAALVDVVLLDASGAVVGGEGTYPGLAAGTYHVLVRSQGGYAEIGAYEIQVQ